MKRSFIRILPFLLLLFALLSNGILFRTALHYYRLYLKATLDPLNIDASSPQVRDPKLSLSPRIIFIGDSRARAWPLPSSLRSKFLYSNYAVSGSTTSQVLGHFSRLSLTLTPRDIIVIQAGINDLKTIPFFPLERNRITELCFENISRLTSLITDSHATVVLTTIIPIGTIPLYRKPFWSPSVEESISQCNSQIKKLASDNVYILDTSILSDQTARIPSQLQLNFLHINSSAYHVLNTKLVSIINSISSQRSYSK
jgi:lysophospholipase L1-like esterase